jgi:adenosylcobinamide-GDP ribazoletransferase
VINELRFALSFLTLLPVSPKKKLEEQVISDSVAFFPVAGVCFTALTVLCIYFNEFFENHWVMAIMIMLSHALLSGGLHFDALMDSHDGLACSDRSREEILRVMKDSRAGAFAVIGLFFVLLVQLVFISQAFYKEFLYLYLLASVPVISRVFLVFEFIFFINPKKLDSKSSLMTFAKTNKTKAILVSLITFVAMHYFYSGTKVCITAFFVIALVFSVLLYRFLNYKLKGKNGDSMGCGLVINEAFMYLLIFLFSAIY